MLASSVSYKADGKYEYRVMAYNSYPSNYTAVKTVTVLKKPTTPANLRYELTDMSDGKYSVLWNASQETVNGYRVEEYERENNGDNLVQGFSLSGTKIEFFNPHEDGKFFYKVVAHNASGDSGWATSTTIEVLKTPKVPGAVKIYEGNTTIPNVPKVEIAESHTGSYTLEWSGSQGYTMYNYEVWRKSETSSWKVISTESATKYFESQVKDGVYSYKVQACNVTCSGATQSVSIPVDAGPKLVADATPYSLPVPEHQEYVGAVQGAAGVSGGAASYQIPITVPPGRRGMQPEVALTYSSRAGNSIAGVGWSISAGSSIHRCPQTAAQDGQSRGIDFTSGDRLCIDGQRMVLVEGYAYGEQGLKYRTEIDGFARITLKGAGMNSTGSYFVVEHKSGLISYYGVSTGSVLTPANGSVPLYWSIRRTQDRTNKGNRTTFFYDTEPTKGEQRLTGIKYSGSLLSYGDREVRFEYESRPDKSQSFLHGTYTSSTERLKKIESYVSSDMVRRYVLEYTTSQATGRSLLHKVQECGATACLPKTTFEYQQDKVDFVEGHYRFSGTGELEFTTQGSPADKYSEVRLLGDYDGDGTRDRLYRSHESIPIPGVAPGAAGGPSQGIGSGDLITERLYLSSREPSEYCELKGKRWFVQSSEFTNSGPLGSNPNSVSDVDLDQDGRTDLLGTTSFVEVYNPDTEKYYQKPAGLLTVVSWNSANCQGTDECSCFEVKETDIPMEDAAIYAKGDFDGNGRMDVLLRRNNLAENPMKVCLQQEPTGTKLNFVEHDAGFDLDFPSWTSTCTLESVTAVEDFNGDGVADLHVLQERQLAKAATLKIFFAYKNSKGGVRFTESPVHELINGYSSSQEIVGYMDANGDGLTDVYGYGRQSHSTPGQLILWLNQGGPAGSKILVKATVAEAVIPWHMRTSLFAMDFDADGREEIFVPDNFIKEWCYYIDLGCTQSDIPPGPGTIGIVKICSNPGHDFIMGDPYNPGTEYQDRSIHGWKAWRLVYDSTMNGYTVKIEATDLQAPIMATSGGGDHFGDGLGEIYYKIQNTLGPVSHGPPPEGSVYDPQNPCPVLGVVGYYTDSSIVQGQRVAKNLGSNGSAPDLMKSVSNGTLGVVSSWEHHPLSSSGSGLCDSTRPLYQAEHSSLDPEVDEGYFYFTSSMYVVSRFEQSNGVGGQNATCYRYEDAMYNTQGRGFQGFGKIIAEEDLAENPQNNLRTITTFHQKFPLAGRVKEVRVGLVEEDEGTNPIRKTTFSWNSTSTTAVTNPYYFPYLIQQIAVTSDLDTRHTLTTVTTSYNAYDAFGNLTDSTIVTDDATMTHTRHVTNTYANDESSWWIDKLDTSTVIDDPVDYKINPIPAETENDSKTVTTKHTWYTDGKRLPMSKTVQPGDVSQWSKVEYQDYDDFGNLLQSAVTAANLAESRTDNYTYDDGYYVKTRTNAEGHTATYSHDPKTGQVTKETDPNGLVTEIFYDCFGRVIGTQTDGVPTAYQSLQWFSDTDQPRVKLKRITVQDGAPKKTEYLDQLGRVIKTAVFAFDEAGEIFMTAEYNARGQKTKESQPSPNSSGAYFTTYESYDALGRVGRKVVDKDDGMYTLYKKLITEYTYDGLTTKITLQPDLPQMLTAKRTYNSLGQLMSTVDTMGYPNYFRYDGQGNPILIQDSVGNQTIAKYNQIGQKEWVDDPDRGKWHFSYSGAGELLSQTDANGDVVSFEYDRIQKTDGTLVAQARPPTTNRRGRNRPGNSRNPAVPPIEAEQNLGPGGLAGRARDAERMVRELETELGEPRVRTSRIIAPNTPPEQNLQQRINDLNLRLWGTRGTLVKK